MYQKAGVSIIGFRRAESSLGPFRAFNPSAGEEMEPLYFTASPAEVDQAAQLASQAFAIYRECSGSTKGAFL